MGVLLACETWSADILLAACAPMISAILHRGDKTQSMPSSIVVRVAQKITLVRTVPVLCSVLCAAVHRRHLMVWAIFAPKFVYDAIGSTVADVCAITLVIFATRTPRASARAKTKAQ
jgi:phosphatidylinositol glycan class O